MNPIDKTNKREIPDDWNNTDPSKRPKTTNDTHNISELANTTINNNSPVNEIKLVKAIEITLPEIWHSASKGDWRKVNELLTNASKEDLSACPLTGEHKGKGILWFLAFNDDFSHQYLCLQVMASMAEGRPLLNLYDKIMKLDPDVVIDKSNPLALSRILDHALSETEPDFDCDYIQKWINLSSESDLYSKPLHARIFLILLKHVALSKKWEVAEQLFRSNPWVIENLHIKNAIKDKNIFYNSHHFPLEAIVQQAIQADRLDIAKNLIELIPTINPSWGYGDMRGGIMPMTKLILKPTANKRDQLAIIKYFIILGADIPKMTDRILKTFDAIIASYDWQNPSKEAILLQYLPVEARDLIAVEAIIKDHPELKSFPKSILLERLDQRGNFLEKNHLEKAVNWTKTLAFKEYRQQNGLQGNAYTKSQIDDYHDTIESSLIEYKNTHPHAKYTEEKRERLVKEIGRDQNVEQPKLKKSFIKESIENVMEIKETLRIQK